VLRSRSCWCNGSTRVTEIYDPQRNAWSTGRPLPDHNHQGAAYGILSDGKLHVVGGFDHLTNVISRSHVVYDFDADIWTTAADLPAPRIWPASGVLQDGRLIVAGGQDSSGNSAATYPVKRCLREPTSRSNT
jgi:hypothetical protein